MRRYHELVRRMDGVNAYGLKRKFPELEQMALPPLAGTLRNKCPPSAGSFRKAAIGSLKHSKTGVSTKAKRSFHRRGQNPYLVTPRMHNLTSVLAQTYAQHRPREERKYYAPYKRIPIGSAEIWIGISTDEASRMKPARIRWQENRWPLIEAGLSRQDCLAWLSRNGFPHPPKSSCIGCPFHTDAMWHDMKTNSSAEWAEATAAIVSFPGALYRGGAEQKIRQYLIDNN